MVPYFQVKAKAETGRRCLSKTAEVDLSKSGQKL
jgi:hypothetical protein